jgi:hypothetical protein
MLAAILAWTALAVTPPIDRVRSTHWINTQPLLPQDLRGHVVVLDFWTYG